MRHHVTIVGRMPALQRHPLAGLAIALVRLARPWEEKPRDSETAYGLTLARKTILLSAARRGLHDERFLRP